MANAIPPALSNYLIAFDRFPVLRTRLWEVLQSLPIDVQNDFVGDSRFDIVLENYEPGKGTRLFMPSPGSAGEGSRCVVLRPKLDTLPEDFAKYVIAHDLAHAFLRNGGWGSITDIEEAADALAASWGYQHRRGT